MLEKILEISATKMETTQLKELSKGSLENVANINDLNEPLKNGMLKIKENASGSDILEKNGGAYKDLFRAGQGDRYEIHHMPADSSSHLETNDGPAIKMDKGDHRQTASCGNSKEARAYREEQRSLIEQGKFREALQMDIDDIRDKFGNKYDGAINEMTEYVDKLEQEGKLNV